jgi:hypothetical protein
VADELAVAARQALRDLDAQLAGSATAELSG